MAVPSDSTITDFESYLDAEHGLHLLVMSAQSVSTCPLPERGTLVIGRARGCDVVVADPLASRRHALLHLGDGLAIEDAGSANGTRLREAVIPPRERVPINPGEGITIGSTVLMVQVNRARLPPHLSSSVRGSRSPGGQASAMRQLHLLAARAAASGINILILGETGVGKEVLARRIHALSPRSHGPLICVNCAGIPESLMESELFGHERGAFTGAVQNKPGLIEAADGGTVFLDEVGELPLSMQAKLLRALETREVVRLGSVRPRSVDVRFVAATNRDLEREVLGGRFRKDLFFRLNGITLSLPPLRERADEIPALAQAFLAEASAGRGGDPVTLSHAALERLLHYPFPGNIRELKNVMERALVLCEGVVIGPEHLVFTEGALAEGTALPPLPPDQESERQRILEALAACAGNQTRAARRLGMSRRTLVARLDTLRIPRPQKDPAG